MTAFCIWLAAIIAICFCVRGDYPPANFKEDDTDENDPYDGMNGV